MNRKQRRAGQSIHEKEVKKAFLANDWGIWEDITNLFKLKMGDRPESFRMKKYVKNNIYSVQLIDSKDGLLIGIRRHDQSIDVPWAHKQRIKNEIMGPEFQAIEVFPKVSELVDDANMYWIWIVNINIDLKTALRGIYSK